jgi:hypothetical protein
VRTDVKAKWVTALRSGNYEQCQGVLQNGQAYCCLGVLQALTHIPTDESAEMLHYEEAYEKLGLTAKEQDSLASMNDAGATFLQIAERIQGEL